jgi:UPF0716 protein FxsA
MLFSFPLIYLVVEIAVFILLGQWIGFGWAVLIALVTPFIGMPVARRALGAMRRRSPGQRSRSAQTDAYVADIAVTMIAAALLVVPGIASFVVGLVLLIPPVRSLVGHRVGKSLGLQVVSFGSRFSGGPTGGDGGRGGTDGAGSWGEVIDHRGDEFGDGSDDASGSAR